MARTTLNSIFILLALLTAACSGVPSDVIQPEEMAQLMADVHTGEAVVDMNRWDYESDSMKLVFKESVYAKHGVTSEQVDSSMAWYGRNITRYMDVYDRTIEILEQRLTETGNREAAAAMSIAGDSVDVWPYPRYLSFTPLSPSGYITFRFNADENWEKGDVYTWRAKFIINGNDGEWGMAATYSDGAVETIYSGYGQEGWREITLRSDSTRTMTSLRGYMRADLGQTRMALVDSIEIIRKRLSPDDYGQRYRQRGVYNYRDTSATTAAVPERPDSGTTAQTGPDGNEG